MTDRSEEKDPLKVTIQEYRQEIAIAQRELIELKRKAEIRNLLERLRVAWERRPEMSLGQIMEQVRDKEMYNCAMDLAEQSDEALISAIEKLTGGEK